MARTRQMKIAGYRNPPSQHVQFKSAMDKAIAGVLKVNVAQIAGRSYCDRVRDEYRYSFDVTEFVPARSMVTVQDRTERIATTVMADIMRKFAAEELPSWQWTKLPLAHVAFPSLWGYREDAYMKIVAAIEVE